MDVGFLLDALTMVNSSRYFLSTVTMSETNNVHNSPLILDMLDRQVFLGGALAHGIVHDEEISSLWKGNCCVLQVHCES